MTDQNDPLENRATPETGRASPAPESENSAGVNPSVKAGDNPAPRGYEGEWRQYPDAPGHRGIDTSIEAADRIAPHCGRLQRLVLGAFEEAGENGLTAFELADHLELDRYSVQPRCTELKVKKLIHDSGERRLAPSGCKARVWRVGPPPKGNQSATAPEPMEDGAREAA